MRSLIYSISIVASRLKTGNSNIQCILCRTCVRPVVVYGGINTGYTIREVLKGCNVLCGTPGRLLDIIGRGKVMFPPP